MKAHSETPPNGSGPKKPPQSVEVYIGEYADYLVCDPDGISTPDGKPMMEPPAAAFRALAYLQELTEHITGAHQIPPRPVPGARTAAGAQAMAHHPHITCPRCGLTSYHPEDIRQRYCGNCHQFHDEMAP